MFRSVLRARLAGVTRSWSRRRSGEWLAGRWEHQWRRPPTGEELGRLVEDFVREEVLYREALALGLDLADLVVRRRLVQKMEVLALADSAPIGDAAVTDYFLAHREDYRLPETISFTHVFFSAAARGGRAAEDARAAWPSCGARRW